MPEFDLLTPTRISDGSTLAAHEPNEDVYGCFKNIFWVLDGATSVDDDVPIDENDPTSGYWIAQQAQHWLLGSESELQDQSPQRILEDLESHIANVGMSSDAFRVPASAVVGLVKLDVDQVQYSIIGDVTLVVQSRGRETVVSDSRVDTCTHDIMEDFRAQLLKTKNHELALQSVSGRLAQHRRLDMNRPGRYWALSTDGAGAASHALTGAIRVAEHFDILLCSDGFSRLVDEYRYFECWSEIFQLLRKGSSVSDLMRTLRVIEAADEQALIWPRWSVEDDATAIYVGT